MKVYELWDSVNGILGFYSTPEKAFKQLKRYFDYLVENEDMLDVIEKFYGCGYYADDNFSIEEHDLDKELKL